MDIKDFLPKYPDIEKSEYNVLNPYKENFYEGIFKKKEFYENRLDRSEKLPKERGVLLRHQNTIARYMSSHTPYEGVLLVHAMGTGKCVAPGTKITTDKGTISIESLWKSYSSNFVEDNEGEWATPTKLLFVDSYDEKNRKMVKRPIKRFYRQSISEKIRTVVLEDGKSITMTNAHRVYTERGWKKDLNVCTYVAVPNEEMNFVGIKSYREFYYSGWVYDLEIETDHNYVANGILTHNTCSAIGAIEQVKNENSTINGAIIVGKGDTILNNWRNELVSRCTAGQYRPDNYEKLTEMERTRRVSKKIKEFYTLKTLQKFGKQLKKMSDTDIEEMFSNKIIVIDEVHNLRIQSDSSKKESLETYEQYHRLLHSIKNSKIILLSGTPMKDSPDEIASVSNLILPKNEQLPTGEKFLQEYMVREKGNLYKLRDDKVDDLKRRLKGKISFLREAHSTVEKKFIGKENYGKLNHLIVDPNKMSKFQSNSYQKAYEMDTKGKTGIWTESREASLFVYPDGSWGRDGFKNYIIKKEGKIRMKKKSASTFGMSSELSSALKGKTKEETLKNIAKHSASYAKVIKEILETDGNCFVYSSLAKGSGGILFSLLLGLFGMGKANGKESNKSPRYAILTNKTASATEIRRIVQRFNKKDNMNGEYIKVIIGSKTVSEGFSFRNVLFEAINTPHWNYSETAQALARGIRHGSHDDMLKEGLTPVVKLLQPVAIPRDGISVDLHMYETSEDKDITIRTILRLLMEVAFDCSLNYFRNHINGEDGSRDCDYTVCNYKCDGMDMKIVQEGLQDDQIDYSTYQLFYANPQIPVIRRKIEKLFRNNRKIDLNSIVANLKGEFSEDEIRNALFTIEEETGSTSFDYRTFLEVYSRSSVKKIMNGIEDLFKTFFSLKLDMILEHFPEYTKFEVLTALRNIINESVIVINKYGLPCYLREEKNIYFLVNNLTIKSTFFSQYYTMFPQILNETSFSDITKKMYITALPNMINTICKTNKDEEFSKLMKSLPVDIQEMFIEASILSKSKKIKKSRDVRKRILDYFKAYIKKVDNVVVSTLLDELRCMENGKWIDCDPKYEEKLEEKETERKRVMRENEYGVVGTYNPVNKSFCLIDVESENKRKPAKKADDKRLQHTGRVCTTWKIPDLLNTAVKRLRINAPDDFMREKDKKWLLDRIKKEKVNANMMLSDLYEKEELKKLSVDELRRILYWGLKPTDGGVRRVKMLCEKIQQFLINNNLQEIDTQCGVQGKRKGATPKGQNKRNFTLRTFVPKKDENEFKELFKDIAKSMKECFNTEKFKPELDTNTWFLVFSRKKVVGFVMLDKEGYLHNVCVSKGYRRSGIPTEAMQMIARKIFSLKGKNPILRVENSANNFKGLVRKYKSFGFQITIADNRYTYMEVVMK